MDKDSLYYYNSRARVQAELQKCRRNSPWVGIVLSKLQLVPRDDLALGVEDEEARAGSALVDGADELGRHFGGRVFGFEPTGEEGGNHRSRGRSVCKGGEDEEGNKSRKPR